MTAVIYAFEYLFAIPIFGFLFWILNGILIQIAPVSSKGPLFQLASHLWVGAIIVFILFGIFWLPRKIKERNEWGY